MRAHRRHRLPNHVIGLILVIVIAVASVLAYTKSLPWSHHFTVKAVFATAQNIRPKSPVRIAGVNVGEVTGVQSLPAGSGDGSKGQAAAVVTMAINDDGLPLHQDATFRLRPRLFLEGNLFVDVRPGSPESPEVSDGYTFPETQTSTSVQLDQVLTTLQAPVRRDLQVFLHEFGDALERYGGAKGFQTFYRTSPGAFRWTSRVNEAFLGTAPHDLSNLVKSLDSTVRALDQNEPALKGLVTNLRIVTGSLAARDRALATAVARLPGVLRTGTPALAHLNASFPPLRAFARAILPGVRNSPETIDAANPFLHQLRGLVSKRELRGLVHRLRPAIPDLAKLADRTVPFLHQSRAISSCFNEVIIPWSNATVPDAYFPAAGNVAEETGYGLAGIAGESRSGDANGEYIRVAAGGGANTLVLPPLTGHIVESLGTSAGVPLFGFVASPILGSEPFLGTTETDPSADSQKTPFRPDAPCERQEPPNLDSITNHESLPFGAPQQFAASASGEPAPPLRQLADRSRSYAQAWMKAQQLVASGRATRSQGLLAKATLAWQKGLPALVRELKAMIPSSAGGSG